jgi:vesicle-associated membrane protein 7
MLLLLGSCAADCSRQLLPQRSRCQISSAPAASFPPLSCEQLSYGYDNYVFHIVVDRGITFLCLADEKQKRRIPFLFLDDVRAKFQAAYGERATTAIAFAMNQEFARVLQDRMDYFNDNPEADSLAKVKGQIEDVKGVMVDNIEKVLARGEKIELLVDKTEQLNQSAKKFQRASKSLKSAMWWKNVKMWGLIFVITVIIIWLIASFICGFDFSKCGAGKK